MRNHRFSLIAVLIVIAASVGPTDRASADQPAASVKIAEIQTRGLPSLGGTPTNFGPSGYAS